MRQHLFVAATLLALIGCSGSFDSERADAERFLDAELPVGVPVERALDVLRSRSVVYTAFEPRECDGFVFEPRFRCLGGPGVVATLESDINPWNPFYSPDLRVFLAFDSSKRLAERTLFVEGGDR